MHARPPHRHVERAPGLCALKGESGPVLGRAPRRHLLRRRLVLRVHAGDDDLQVLVAREPGHLLALGRRSVRGSEDASRVQLALRVQRVQLLLVEQWHRLLGVDLLGAHGIEVSYVVSQGTDKDDVSPVRRDLDGLHTTGMQLCDIPDRQKAAGKRVEFASSDLKLLVVAPVAPQPQAAVGGRLPSLRIEIRPTTGGVVDGVGESYLVDDLRPDVRDVGGVVQPEGGGEADDEDGHQPANAKGARVPEVVRQVTAALLAGVVII
mmetsp:Transcript_17331/g.52224  ORF Transcript_17331/g.52224 Transcript_17331/m.52224 type:complete len:264 (-) Transcript_17331:162-953(-)